MLDLVLWVLDEGLVDLLLEYPELLIVVLGLIVFVLLGALMGWATFKLVG